MRSERWQWLVGLAAVGLLQEHAVSPQVEDLVRKLSLVKGSTWGGRQLGSILGPLSCVQMGRISTSYLETGIPSLGSAPLPLAGAALGYDPHCPGHLSWILQFGAGVIV